MRLQVDIVKMIVQAVFGEKGCVRATAVLFDKIKVQITVLADFLACLLAKVKQGIILFASALVFNSVLYDFVLHHVSLPYAVFCRSYVCRQDVSVTFGECCYIPPRAGNP